MALTIDTYYRIKDAKGDVSTVVIPIPAATSLANASTFVHDMTALIQPLIEGLVVSAGFSLNLDISADVGAATVSAIADVQEKATFAYKTVNDFLKKVSIPTFKEAGYVAGSALVDLAETAVAAFNTAMTVGVPLVAAPCDAHGDDLDFIDAAFEAWGKARG